MEVIAQSKKYNPDRLATYLINMSNQARTFPAGVGRLPIIGKDGFLGEYIPGKGIYLPFDLKELGITKAIPGVYEYSPIQRLKDIIGNEVGAVNTLYDIYAALQSRPSRIIPVIKNAVAVTANNWSNTFTSGGVPAAGTYSNIPGGAALNSTSTGAWNGAAFDPVNPDSKYLVSLGFGCSTVNTICYLIHDLLVAAGNISATSTSAQTVNSTALTRYTDGAGVMMTFDVTSALGATPSDITTTYTNQGGTGSRSTGAIALTASAAAQRLTPTSMGPFIALQAGDYGVRSVETVQLSADMGSGTLALNLFKPLFIFPGTLTTAYYDISLVDTLAVAIKLATEAGGTLGCLNGYILAAGTTATQTVVFNLRLMDA